MKKEKSRIVHEVEDVKNFKELIDKTAKKYPTQVAYRFKGKKGEFLQKTYQEFQNDIKALSTKLLHMGLKGKKIAVIGNNRYEWCTTYLAVTTGGMIIVPLDKALPENELQSLLTRSKASAIVCEEKYLPMILPLKGKTLEHIICMDETTQDQILSYNTLLEERKNVIKTR